MTSTRVEFNHFGSYAGDMRKWIASLADDTAKQIASDIRSRLGGLADVDVKQGDGESIILVGPGNDPYWLGFVEYGTATRPAKPRVTPAAEGAKRGYFQAAQQIEQAFKR